MVVNRDQLDTWCERGILGLVLIILGFSALATGATRAQDFLVVEWLTIALLVVWLARFWINPKHRLFWPLLCWPALGFILYAAARYTQADIEFVARQEFIRVLVYGVIFFAVLNNLHRQETTHIVGTYLLFIGMAIGLYALCQFLTDSNHVWGFERSEIYRKRGSGTFMSPNQLAGFLEILLPLGLAYTLMGRLSHLQKVFFGYASLAIFAGIVVTISRGGWFGAGLSMIVLVVYLVRVRDYRWQTLLLVVAMAGAGYLFLGPARLSQNRIEQLTFSKTEEEIRYTLWREGLEIWKDNFWFGAGPAHFDYRYRQYRPPSDQAQGRPERVHNDYINTLADWGLIGALLVAAVWVLFYWEVFRSWSFVKRSQNDLAVKRSNKSTFVLGGSLGLLAVLAHSMVDFNMHIPAIAILTVTMLALVAGHFRFATEKYWHTARLPLKLAISIFLISGLIYLSGQVVQRTHEVASLVHADRSPNYSEAQIKYLENAFASEPRNPSTAYNLGECFRSVSWQGGEDYREWAAKAMDCYKIASKLNPWDPYPPMRFGMCLDWTGRFKESEPYYHKALELDPNNFYTVAHMGWHFAQLEQWDKAFEYFVKSWSLNHIDNQIARMYLPLSDGKRRDLQAQLKKKGL
ncbi:MAG TPA: O-antigen ligase family protein [Verrucomicrobiae bacterium]